VSANDTPTPAAAELRVDPVGVTPGVRTDVPVQVTNLADGPCTFVVEVVGLEPEWTPGTITVGPLAPGATGQAVLQIQLPVGHPASRLVAAVTARPTVVFFDQATPERAWRDGRVDLVLDVGDGTLIGAVLEPAEVRGAHRAHLDVVLHNRSKAPQRVDLRATVVDPGVTVEFRDRSHVLAPGEEVRVRTRLHGPRPFAGAPRRRPFGVRVQGRGTPVVLEGSFTQRPVLAGWLTKTVAIVAVVALWVALAVVAITALDKHIHTSATAKSVAGAPPLAAAAIPGAGHAVSAAKGAAKGHVPTIRKPGSPKGSGSSGSSTTSGPSVTPGTKTSGGASPAPTAAPPAGASSSGPSSSSGGASPGSGGSTGQHAAGSGSSGTAGPSGTTGSSATSSGSKGSGGSAAPAKGARVSGKLAGPQPGGVTVSISPTSLVDENSEDANLTSSAVNGTGVTEAAKISSSAADTPIGKVYGEVADASVDTRLTADTTPTQTTKTAPDGSWAFAGLQAPGDYLVTFSRDGYETAKYIVTTASATSPVTLSASLSPATGAISGTVDGPSGPLGDADITITDGRITATTKTPTVGATGTWAVTGLNTPDTYLVTAVAPGYGAQTTLVKLAAGGNRKDIDLTLSPGVGTITGTVTSAASGAGEGGIKVTASSGKFSLSATTTTVSPVGSYTLPNLPIPGTYTLTVSGIGWVSQTQQVILTGNPVVNAALVADGADVNGVASSSTGGGLAGAGAILANGKNTFKTLTESAAPVGAFDFSQVPPGQYVLSVEDFGYTTASAEVTVADGTTKTVDLTLPFVGATNENTGTVQGSVSDFLNATPISGATVTIDGGTTTAATTGAGGTYQIANVGPGIHTITASAKGYESASVTVSASLGAIAFAPPILLPVEDTVAGTVLSNAGGVVADPQVQIINPDTNQVVASTTSPLSTPTVTGIPTPAQGGFQIDDVPHGNYLMEVSAPPATGCGVGGTAGTEAFVPSQTQVTVAVGTNLILTGNQSPTLNLEPSFNVVTLQASATSLPIQVGGVAVTIKDLSNPSAVATPTPCLSPPPPAAGATPTDLVIPDLANGDSYQATLSLAGDAPETVKFTGTLNNSTIDTVVLASPVTLGPDGNIDVSLDYAYRTQLEEAGGTVNCSVAAIAQPNPTINDPCPAAPDLPEVQMTGTTSYDFPSPGQATSPIQQTFNATPPSAANCQAQVASQPTAPGCDWTFPGAELSALLPSSVTFTVSDPDGAFEQLSKTDDTSDPGFAVQDLLLTPTPSTAPCIAITPTSGVSIATTPVIAGVTLAESALSTGCSTAEANTTNTTWNDGASSSPGSVEPGVYELNFTDPGYEQVPDVLIEVPLHGTKCYVTGAECGLSPQSVTLVAAAYITGTVVGVINNSVSPLAGIKVVATLIAGGNAGCDSEASAVTQSDGSFDLGGSSANNATLCSGALYQVTAPKIDGYQAASPITFPLGAGGNPLPGVLVMQAVLVNETVNVSGISAIGTNGVPLVGATVVAVSGLGIEPAPATTTCTMTGPSGCTAATAVVAIDPTTYTFAISYPGYETVDVGPVPFTPSANATANVLDVVLTLDQTAITGTVTAAGPQGTTEPLVGVPVTLTNVTPGQPATQVAEVTTGAGGSYTVSSTTTPAESYIPDGTYVVGVTLDGYSYVQPPVAFSKSTPVQSSPTGAAPSAYPAATIVQQNIELEAQPVTVKLPITSTLASDTLAGAEVTLTPVSTAANPGGVCEDNISASTGFGTSQTVGVVGGVATFDNLVPDDYTVSVDDTNHPGAVVPAGLTVCPSSTTETPQAVQLQEGEISGTVTATDGTVPSAAQLTITDTTSRTVYTPSLDCLPNGTCSYETFLPLESFNLQATLAGYTSNPSVANPIKLTTTNTTATWSTSLTPASHEVCVTVESAGTSPEVFAPQNATVTLTGVTGVTGTYGTTNCATGFDFASVAPGTYPINAAFGDVTATGTVQVSVANPGGGPVLATATGNFGSISGTVAPTGTVLAITAGSGNTVFSLTCAAASCAYTAYVPLGSTYTASATLTGYHTQTNNITLDTAGPTATFSATLVVEDHEVCVAAQSDTTPPLAAPTTATVTLTGVTGNGTYGTTNCSTGFDFTGVAPGTHTARADFDGFTLTGTFPVPTEDTSNDPVPGTADGPFAQVSNGSVTLNPAPGAATTVGIAFCTDASSTANCTATVINSTTAQVAAAATTATFGAYVSDKVEGMIVSATGYTSSGVVTLAVSDGVTVTPAQVTLASPPPPTTTTTSTTTTTTVP
jgi:hypothetical protein